jgi:triacylglycerol lipase
MILSAWLGAALSFLDGTARAPQEPAPDRNPVLLIHGIADDERTMNRMATYLRANGWEVHTLSLKPNWGQAGLAPLAGQIDTYASAHLSRRKFDLVGFSMGGLVSRYYVQRLGGVRRIERFITLAAPHHGTALAHLIPNRGCREMRPDSAFLRDLARDADKLRRVKFTSFYTSLDLVILPAKSSAMPQARNVKLPVGSHPGMVLEKRSLRAVAGALRA